MRRTARRALLWGGGALGVAGVAAWMLRGPETATVARALQILAGYALLFLATLAKILWTARGPAAIVAEEALLFQPLHRFRPRRLPWSAILACAPRAGTESLRLVVTRRGAVRELFLNLGLVERRHDFLAALEAALRRAGLEPVPGERSALRRPGFADPGPGVGG